MKGKLDIGLVFLALAMGIAPLLGGHVSLDSAAGGSLLTALTAGPEAPLLSHFLIALPVAIAFGLMLRKKVIQVPNMTFCTVILVFFGLLTATVVMSHFRLASIAAASQWLVYLLALLTVVGSVGRGRGSQTILIASFVGCVLLALKGLAEYGDMKAIDPSWRIFAGWVNPNATAAMFLVGLFLGLALLQVAEDRLHLLLLRVGTVLIGLGLGLTGSKGGLLVAAVTVPIFLGIALSAAPRERQPKVLERTLTTLVAFVALFALIQFQATRPASPSGPAATSRLAQAESTSEQSAGFRSLLWKGAGQMIRQNPVGTGIGTYRFESGRTGLHTQTVLAHQSFLQLATEGSPLLPFLLVLAGALWIRLAFRGWKSLPYDRRMMQAGVFSAVATVVAHSLIDSDLYYFGIGLTFFGLLGLGLLLSADAVAPEFTPTPLRGLAGAGAVIVLGILGYVATGEVLRSEARMYLQAREIIPARAAAEAARNFSPLDGEAWYLTALMSVGADQVEAAKTAVLYAPSSRNRRFLARTLAKEGKYAKAISEVDRALYRDPSSLQTLLLAADLRQEFSGVEASIPVLKRMIAIEDTPYFTIRSLPDLIPTETYEARVRLAGTLPNGLEKVEHLQKAMDGFKLYLARTVPVVKQMAAQTPPADYAGESEEDARKKMEQAATVAKELAEHYRAAGDPTRVTEAESALAAFEGAFAK